MNDTTIPGFSHAEQQAQQWVNELAEDLDWQEGRAYRLLRSVLHALRDWLSMEETADLSAQLPVLIRGILFDGWKPQDFSSRTKDDFVSRIWNDLGDDLIYDTMQRSPRCSGFLIGISHKAKLLRSGVP